MVRVVCEVVMCNKVSTGKLGSGQSFWANHQVTSLCGSVLGPINYINNSILAQFKWCPGLGKIVRFHESAYEVRGPGQRLQSLFHYELMAAVSVARRGSGGF